MIRSPVRLLLWISLTLSMIASASGGTPPAWTSLPSLPDPVGLAGMYAGVSHGALVAAGGANFPGRPMAEGGKKAWHAGVYVLPSPDSRWKEVGRLPLASGYGMCATWRDSVVCIGGDHHGGNFSDGWILNWDGQALSIENLPPLPVPDAYGACALVNDTVYVLGGQDSPAASTALARAFALDLGAPPAERHWREIPWPSGAPGRIIPVAASHDGLLYLFSGVELRAAADKTVERVYLKDAYAYSPAKGWRRLADLPEPVAAAPSPAFASDSTHLTVLAGVNAAWGSPTGPSAAKGGFERTLFSYDIASDRWEVCHRFPADSSLAPARVTAPLVAWNGGFAIPGGEIAPGIRTPSILFLRPSPGRGDRSKATP